MATAANTLWIMFLPFFYDFILSANITDKDWRLFVVGAIYTAVALVQAVSVSAGGKAADRFGRKQMIVAGSFCYSFGPLIILSSVLVFAINPLISTILAITGHSWTLFSGGLTRSPSAMLLVESSAKKNRGLSYMIATRVIPSIPPAILILVGTDLYATGMFWFALEAAFCVLFASAVLFFVRLNETISESNAPTEDETTAKTAGSQIFVLLLIASFALDGLSSKGISWYVSLWVGTENLYTYGYMIMVSTLVIAAFGLVAGRLVDRFGIRKSLTLGWLLLSITVFVFPHASSMFEVLFLYSLWTGLDMIDLSIPPLIIAERFPQRKRATIMGYFSSSVSVISIAGPAAIAIFQLLGPTIPFIAKSVMNLIALLAFLFATHRKETGIETEATALCH
jgi:MFS family permease